MESFSEIMAIGSLVLGALGLIIFFIPKTIENSLVAFLRKDGTTVLFMVSFLAVVASLFYSDVLKLEPCKLCWYQRIVMYSTPLLLGVAMIRKEAKQMLPYVKVLSGVGLAIALFHYASQKIPSLSHSSAIPLNCGVSGPSCTEAYIEVFGFVTIPLMAVFSFFFVFALARFLARRQ